MMLLLSLLGLGISMASLPRRQLPSVHSVHSLPTWRHPPVDQITPSGTPVTPQAHRIGGGLSKSLNPHHIRLAGYMPGYKGGYLQPPKAVGTGWAVGGLGGPPGSGSAVIARDGRETPATGMTAIVPIISPAPPRGKGG